MPSIIVETAFHTNPDDAKALQDPVFRLASMKGVEKGYRLWASGKTCEPLALHPVPDTDVPIQAARDIELDMPGIPSIRCRLSSRWRPVRRKVRALHRRRRSMTLPNR